MSAGRGNLRSDIAEVFGYFDRNGDGLLDYPDLGRALRSLGCFVKESELDNLRQTQVFPMSLEVFSSLVVKLSKHGDDSGAEILKAFQTFDVKNRGKISIKDLRHYLVSLGESLNDEELDSALRYAGIGLDQQELNYNEFCKLIKG